VRDERITREWGQGNRKKLLHRQRHDGQLLWRGDGLDANGAVGDGPDGDVAAFEEGHAYEGAGLGGEDGDAARDHVLAPATGAPMRPAVR